MAGLTAACCLISLGLLFWPTGALLIQSWARNPDYSHAWLLVPIVVWLFGRKSIKGERRSFECCSSSSNRYLGTASILMGGVIHLIVQILPAPLLDYLAWVLIVGGMLLAGWGWEACRFATPALSFSFFIFPLPPSWLNAVAMWLQDLVSQSASTLINAWTVCHQRGNMLYVAGLEEPFSVGAECSGLRQVMIFLALSSLMACFLSGSWFCRAALILAAVPIAIFVNVIRVVALICIARIGNTTWIEGTWHDLPLIITLPSGAILLWFCYRYLQERRGVSPPVVSPIDCEFHQRPYGAPPSSSPWLRYTFSYLLVPLSLLVFAQFMLQRHLQAAVKNVIEVDPALFNKLPLQLDGWTGRPHPQADEVAHQADFADGVLTRAYVNPAGQAAALYLVYSRNGQDRDHHPEICLGEAAGATEIQKARQTIPLQAVANRLALRTCYQTQHLQRTTIYYWHYTLVPSDDDSQSFLQRLYLKYRESWPSLTVQVQTNQSSAAVTEAIETTLLPEIDRWLQMNLPASAKVGHERRSIRLEILSH
jgi:exosortase